MLERINNEIIILNQVLKTIKNLEENEEVEIELKQNKYLKETTNKYFEGNVLKTIVEHKKLLDALKQNHIRLTEEQKEIEKREKEYLKEIETIIEKILKILDKLKTGTVYIDSDLIDILKLNETEDLKQIIEYNKTINLKKNGIEEKEEKKEQKVKEKKEPRIEPKKKTQNKKRQKEPKPEKVLIFNTREELNKYLSEKYNIEVSTEKDLEELNDMIEIIENEPYEIKESELVKRILETSSFQRLKDIKKELKETNTEIDEIKDIEEVFDKDESTSLAISAILYSNLDKETKGILLKKNKERKQVYLRNKLLMQQYNLCDIQINYLGKKVNETKIDQIIELGFFSDIAAINRLYKTKTIENVQLEDTLEDKAFVNIPAYFFETMTYSGKINVRENGMMLNEMLQNVSQGKEGITEVLGNIQKIINQQKNISLTPQTPNINSFISRNPILKKEEETNNCSKENFLRTHIPFWYKIGNPIYELNNPYFKAIEKEYTNDNLLTYRIPVGKNICKNDRIEISKNKVIRLLNAHLLAEDEITPEIIKQCMMYNLVTTEEILEKLDSILTSLFEKVNKKIKKY